MSCNINEGFRRPNGTRRNRLIEPRNDYLSDAFDSTIYTLREFVKMKHQARLQNIRITFLWLDRLLRRMTKVKGAPESLAGIGKCLAYRIAFAPVFSEAVGIELYTLS